MAARPGRVVAITVVAVLVLGLAGDFGARFWAQSVLANRLQKELALSERPQVGLGGFPFLVALARRRFPTATVRAEGLRARDLSVQRVALDFKDVRFSTRGGIVRAASGDGEVELTEQDVSSYVQARGAPLAVAFLGPEVRVRTNVALGDQQGEASATGRLRLRNGTLRFRPETIEAAGFELDRSLFSFDVPLPPVLDGLTYESLTVGQGSVVLRARVGETIVRLAV